MVQLPIFRLVYCGLSTFEQVLTNFNFEYSNEIRIKLFLRIEYIINFKGIRTQLSVFIYTQF